MNEYASSKGETWRFSCWMLVQKDNYHEMSSLLDIARQMGFTRVAYNMAISDWGGIGDWTEVNGEKNIGDEFTEKFGRD